MDSPTTDRKPATPFHPSILRRICLAVRRKQATWEGIQMRDHYRHLAAVWAVGFGMISMSASAAPPGGTALQSPSDTVIEARPTFHVGRCVRRNLVPDLHQS